MTSKRLLIFHPFLTTYRLDLYNFLAKRFELKVVLWYPNVDNSKLGFNRNILVEQAVFNFQYLKKQLQFGSRIINFSFIHWLKNFKPDIVLPHEFGFNSLITILLRNILNYRIFLTCDDSPQMVDQCKGIRRILRGFAIRHIDGLVAVNPDSIEKFRKYYPNSKCNYFYLPIIQDEKVIKEKLKRSLSISKAYRLEYDLYNSQVFLFVGRLVEVKGLDVLIVAFNYVRCENPQARLVIVGEGILKERLINQVTDLGLEDSVHFIGQRSGDELFAWYNVGQVLVLPSRFEPFGAVVNEALASGCKVVVSDQVGAQCLVDSKNGYVFKNEDAKELSECMASAIGLNTNVNGGMIKNSLMGMSFANLTNDFVGFISEGA